MPHTYFKTSGYSPKTIIPSSTEESIDLMEVAPFLRTLLVADGTVTKMIEAYFWEKIRIQPIFNEYELSETIIDELNCPADTKILRREVLLAGQESSTTYAAARSLLVTEYLPEEMVIGLEHGEIGIGELLRIEGCETYRDIMNIHYYPEQHTTDELLGKLSGSVISRSYRISVNQDPVILVTEYFPLNIYHT